MLILLQISNTYQCEMIYFPVCKRAQPYLKWQIDRKQNNTNKNNKNKYKTTLPWSLKYIRKAKLCICVFDHFGCCCVYFA